MWRALLTLPLLIGCAKTDFPTECNLHPEQCCELMPSHPVCASDTGAAVDSVSTDTGDLDTGTIDSSSEDTTDSSAPDTAIDVGPCESGTVSCVGAERVSCADGGTTTLETCASAKLCEPAGCKTPVCSAGGLRCAGNILQTCNSDRDGYVDKSTCRVKCSATPEMCVNPAGLAVESGTVCAWLSDSTARCWGLNDMAQIGDGSIGGTRLIPTEVKSLTGVTYVAGGGTHSCALRSDKTVWCWGTNTSGQLGDGTNDLHGEPVKVVGLSNVKKLAVGVATNCAIVEPGEVWCWGWNQQGTVGDSTTTNRKSPVKLSGITAASDISCGYFHCCAIDGGAVKCWGGNGVGQIGDNSTTERDSPTSTVPALTTATMIEAGSLTTCARLADGTAMCWGANDQQQVGDSTLVNRLSPTKVPGLAGVVEVRVSNIEGCARLSDGTLWCWGNKSTATPSPPTKVASLSGVTAVALGNSFRCAMSGGDIQCWGRGDQGSIGDGGGVDRSAPTNVKW